MTNLDLNYDPILPVITIQKKSNPAQVFTFNHFTGVYDFQLLRWQFAPRYLNTAGYFEIDIADEDGNGIFDELEGGSEVTIWIGKDDASKVKKFLGVIGNGGFGIITESQDDAYIRITGPDWGSQILSNRILNNYIKQKLNSEGMPDDTDDRTKVKTLYEDILTNARWYPAQGLTIEDQGVTVDSSNIDVDPDLKTSELGASMQFAEDTLRTLDQLTYGAVHDIDPDKNFRVYVPTAKDSGIILVDSQDDSVALTYSTDKVGLIVDKTEFWNNFEEYRKSIWGVGASRGIRDTTLYETADGGSESLYNKSWAIKIGKITNITPQYIGVKLYRVGTVPVDISIELREDSGGQPKGNVVRTVNLDKGDINEMTAGDFRYMDLTGEQLNSQADYWLILYANGTDASNAPIWYRDSSTTTGVTRAYSTDNGSTWTTESDSYQFTLDYWYLNELRDNAPNDHDIIGGDNFFAEEIIRQPDLKDDAALSQLLDAAAAKMFHRKNIFKCMVFAPETPLDNGQKVRVRVQHNPIKTFDYNNFVVTNIEYIGDAESDESDGTYFYDVTLVRVDTGS